jgi:hypothetical protein
MIGMSILTIGALAFVGVMGNISKSLHMSKASTLASNLAQEKIESLKNLSYYRLLVTTATASAVINGETIHYDSGYYAPEDLTVGQIDYRRAVLVQKVTETGGALSVNNWYDSDTGMKLITVHVTWQEGGVWRKITITNLRDNPSRTKMDASFTGTVLSGSTPLFDALVRTQQNPLFQGMSDASGVYSFSVSSGSYELRASKRGYFPVTITSTVSASSSQTVNFNLTAMGYGTVIGQAYLRDHLVVAAVCGSVNGDDNLEYVELYNPTESTFTMHNGVSPSYEVDYIRTSDDNITQINPLTTTRYVNPTLLPHHFYLFASSANVAGVMADAYYSDGGLINVVPGNRIPLGESGGVRLYSLGTYETALTKVDAVGWGHSGGSPYGPDLAREGDGMQLSGGSSDGIGTDQVLERMAYSSSTAASMGMAGIHANAGNAFDSEMNSTDWVFHSDITNDTPNNSATFEDPQTGTPAAGAAVYINDGLSSSAVASSTGAFAVPMVATGTWSISVSSRGWLYSQENAVIVTAGATTDLKTIAIVTPGTMGFASGRVVNSVGAGLSGISVTTSGGSDITDTAGYYRLQLLVGTFTIVANSNNSNSLYTTAEADDVVINIGLDTAVPDIILYQGGILKGFVTANGTDPLPGVPIIATETTSGALFGNAISDAQGYFVLKDLPVDSYTLSPQLDVGESASPASFTKTVVSGATVFVGTFTVSNAFGHLQGLVLKNSAPITTGVLVMAVPSPNTMGASPPVITSSLRTGPVVYYSATSDSDGNYSMPLRAGTYNVYAWYTTFDVNVASVTRVSQSASVSSGGAATLNLSW